MSKENNHVLVLTTGGTIEKSYCESEGVLENRESLLKERLLAKLRLPYTKVSLREIMAKDSLHITNGDREIIWRQIESHFGHDRPIVVLHGTDTMSVTADFCFKKNPRPPVPVVFTGAMRPAGFEDSDASQNFVEALMASQVVEPGIYISFHGRLFAAPGIRKNREKGTFERV